MTLERKGWLLDVYAGQEDGDEGVILWLLGEDGQRYRLHQPFPITFYAAGPAGRLRALWRYLLARREPLSLFRTQRRDLFSEQPLTVMAVQVARAADQPRLFYQLSQSFPDLTYFDADIPLTLRYAARYDAFPLARCRVAAQEDGQVQTIETLDSPWDLEPPATPLRVLSLEPDSDPAHRAPQHLLVRSDRRSYRLALHPLRPFMINLRAILRRHDPDLLLTAWGDTWLLPRLLELSQETGFDLPLNRDAGRQVEQRPERSYFSYGQVVYRGRQVHLFGRWHVDRHNAVLWNDYRMDGVLEIARITALPVQTAARVSPGTGISAMQMLTALRQATLVPWHKQQAEYSKPAAQLFSSDQGGLVYQPLTGLHHDVAEIDFISMYPGIMVHFNISPETVGAQRPDAPNLADLEVQLDAGRTGGRGLIPETLAPLLEKRVELKTRLANLSHRDARYRLYKARSTAHKWLLVTCFGYLGYKNARFGRIEAHEAVTAYGREALLRAKEAAEARGFTVLQMYVDGLWVKRPGACSVADFQPLLDDIVARTGLPVALDGIYRWVAFLASRQDKRVPVPNRYFGLFRDGTLKMRGIEVRRRDTPGFISELQMRLLGLMAAVPDSQPLRACLPEVVALLRCSLADLRAGRVPLEKLLVKQRLSRGLDEYRTPSPAARAAAQLEAVGKSLRPGQSVRFLYTLGEPGIYAWDLPQPPDFACVDVARYTELLLRAASSVLEPLGVSEQEVYERVVANARCMRLPGMRPKRRSRYEIAPISNSV
jgi:DNA polymerase-2